MKMVNIARLGKTMIAAAARPSRRFLRDGAPAADDAPK